MIFTGVGCDWNIPILYLYCLLVPFHGETNILSFRYYKVGDLLKVLYSFLMDCACFS